MDGTAVRTLLFTFGVRRDDDDDFTASIAGRLTELD